MTKKSCIISFLIIFAAVLISLPFVIYLKVLPYAVSNEKVIAFVSEVVKESTGAELVIENPELKTQIAKPFAPRMLFRINELSLTKDKKQMLSVKNLETMMSFEKIFDKTLMLKQIGLDYFYADVNALMALAPEQKQPQKQQQFDWKIDWLDSLLYLKDCEIVYALDKATRLDIKGKNLVISDTREPKLVRFGFDIDITKGKDKLKLTIDDGDKVFIKDKKIVVDNAVLGVNGSKVFLKAEADKKNNFSLTVFSKKFDVKDAVKLLQTNLVVPNGSDMLVFFKDIKGDFDFSVNMTNKDLNGKVTLNNGSLKIIPLNNLPVVAQGGVVDITANEIFLKDFKGYYGTSKANHVQMAGNIKDYTKSVDTNIEVNGVATNDLTKNYLSKLVGCPLTLTGDSGSKIVVKSKYNKIDLSIMGKIAKGYDILVDGMSLSPVNYDRAYKADIQIDGNNLDIKSINYYIAQEINKNSKIRPILTVDGNMDMATLQIHKLGFNIPKPLPSEFLNVLIGQKVFKRGTIAGNMYYLSNGKIPKLKGQLEMHKVAIPSQRMFIKEGIFNTDKDLLHITSEGKFKRSDYKFNGNIVNELIFPVIIKDINLTVDNIDIDRMLMSMNKQNTQEVAASNSQEPVTAQTLVSASNDNENDYDSYTFDTGLLIVERCVLHVVKGFYKDINFGNLYANLTLDKNGLLKIQSNKFDFAEGISTLKVMCDLKKHDYSIRLGVKDINSDLIAGTLLGLKKEISGKAMGLIELNTDDSLKLNGRIRFDIQNGTIQKVGLVQYALNFAALFRNPITMISPSTIVDLVNIPEGTFKKINGDLVMKDNVVEKIMIKSSAAQLSSFIIGRYEIETGDASLRIYTKFSSKNKGFAGFLRNLSLNSLANKVSVTNRNDSNYYAAELKMIPELEIGEEESQVFLTKVDGDVINFNFLSSLKKIK